MGRPLDCVAAVRLPQGFPVSELLICDRIPQFSGFAGLPFDVKEGLQVT